MIRFDQVTKTYAGTTRPALNNVSLEVLKGEFVFLVGASGSGKSSFLRLVLKEEKPSKGKIHVLGQELNTLASRKVPYFRRNLGVVFQDFRLLPNKTVFDNVAFSLQVIGKSKGFIQEAVPDVLKMVGLAGKQQRYPHELSGGEQQRVAIARAVVNKPAILLADEPTGNLDPNTSAGIMNLLAAINANGTTVLMATHDVGIVDQMQRRVIELVSGQIVRDERGGGYQTQAVPVQRNPRPAQDPVQPVPGVDGLTGAADAAAAAVAEPSAPAPAPVEEPAPATASARPEPARIPEPPAPPVVPRPEPGPDTPTTGTITVVEPEVVRATLANRPAPPAERSTADPSTAEGPPAERPAGEAPPAARSAERSAERPVAEPKPDPEPTPLNPPPLNEPRRR